jgi:hypothetical protein
VIENLFYICFVRLISGLLPIATSLSELFFFWINENRAILKFDLFVQDAGVEVDPFGDLNTETERKLGQLVLEK